MDRVRHDDAWLSRFLNHHEGDLNDAFNMLWETCEWRKSMKVNGKRDYGYASASAFVNWFLIT